MYSQTLGKIDLAPAYQTRCAQAWSGRAPIVLLLVAAAAWAIFHPVNHDVSWYLYASRSILGGATLYVDIIDNNPPLVFAFHLGPAWVADKLGVSDSLVFHVGLVFAIGLSLALCRRILHRTSPETSVALRRGHFFGLILILVPFVGVDFGQREHILLVLIMPYVLSVADRAGTSRRGCRSDWLIGALAGLGLALKPHFLIVWIALESYLLFARKIKLIRAENIAISIFLAAYGVVTFVVTPEYIRTIVPLATKLYGAYDCTTRELLLGLPTAICGLAALLFWIRRDASPTRELERVLLITMCSLFFVAAIQQKGWSYHFYPAKATAVLLAVVSFLNRFARDCPAPLLLRRGVPAGVLTAALALSLLTAGNVLAGSAAPLGLHSPAMAQLVRERANGDSIAVLSTQVSSSFPLINVCRVTSALRFNCLWLLPGHYTDVSPDDGAGPFPYHAPGEMDATERYLFDSVVADVGRSMPALLIVDQRASQLGTHDGRFDLLDYFLQDERFATLFHDYRQLDDIAGYAVFERVAAGRTSGAVDLSVLHEDPMP